MIVDWGSSHPIIGIRCDIDALPITELCDVPFKSCNEGHMHACGHDSHTALGLTLLKICKDNNLKFPGTLRIYFQANEEGSNTGGERIANMGLIDDVDDMVCYHVDPRIETGIIGIKADDYNACCDEFHITFIGKGGHAAYPHLSHDPIAMLVEAYNAITNFRNREIPPYERCVISMTMINAGVAYNVIPDTAELVATIRCYSKELEDFINKRVKEIAESCAKAYGGTIEYNYRYGCLPFKNTPSLIDDCKVGLIEAIGEDHVYVMPQPSFGADDFAYYVNKAKRGAMLALGCMNTEKGWTYPLHNAHFMLDEDCFEPGLKGYLCIINHLFNKKR